ncbi:MAG: radical SAM protein [Deltaproteobacteria bacterium]|nr:radical SAM protein [Deltaproteobacteria bacterium]
MCSTDRPLDRPARPYLFYGATRALCSRCLRVVDAKELIQDGKVYLQKRCPEHGRERVLISDDVAYFRRSREDFLKPPEQVLHHNTPIEHGCPYDCGICPDHEQHGCVSILEVTDRCNLRCPTCYAGSGPDVGTHRSLAQIEAMLDRIIANEGEADVVQVSGGEPTLHPEFFAILDACRARPIRHLMVNTNGIRIAKDPEFAKRLAEYGPGFEVYLQFDSLERDPLMTLRGADLRDVRAQALDRLDELDLSTTLVVTVRKGLNDHELGAILEHAQSRPSVRGVTFQPEQHAGRNEGFDPAVHRLTLSEVRRSILEQFPTFQPDDILPVPCHPDALAMAYAVKDPAAGTLIPLTRYVDPELLISGTTNTIVFEGDPTAREAFRAHLTNVLSTGHGPEGAAESLRELLCCLPGIAAAPTLGYRDVFRVVIMQFLDAHSLDLRSVRKSCVHIAHPDGQRMIPFDTFNLFYRGSLEAERLVPLRAGR